jgi:hypothetical protein
MVHIFKAPIMNWICDFSFRQGCRKTSDFERNQWLAVSSFYNFRDSVSRKLDSLDPSEMQQSIVDQGH